MSAPSRRPEINRRRQRTEKINKLRRRYANAKSEPERRTVLEKLRKLSPQMKPEEFTGHKAAQGK